MHDARHQLRLPALLSDSPLGFLAALGTLELISTHLETPPRLSWAGPAAPAILHTRDPLSHEELADLLRRHLPKDRKAAKAEPFPDVPGLLTLPKAQAADGVKPPNEPLRMPIDLALERLRGYTSAEREEGATTARWFTALVNQLALKSPDGKHATKSTAPLFTTTTPLFSPSGQMTLANNWTKAAQRCLEDPGQLLSALTNWQRVDGYAGASLDHYSTGDAHMVSDGEPSQYGVPGATWLALHGFAAFRLTGDGTHPATTAWHRDKTGARLIWPTWNPPLTRTAIPVLLEHPLVRAHKPTPEQLRTLGVTAIYTSRRPRLSKSDGPLETGRILWPEPRDPHA